MVKGHTSWGRRQNCRHQSFNLPSNKVLSMVFMPLLPKSDPPGLQPWGKHCTSILKFWLISQSLLVCSLQDVETLLCFPLMNDTLLDLLSFIFSRVSLMFSCNFFRSHLEHALGCGECAQVVKRFELLSSYHPPWDSDYNLHSHCEG